MDFRLKTLLHVVGILLTVLLLAWCLLNTSFYATMLCLALLLVLQVAALWHHVGATNREVARFLGAIRHADFSQSFRGRRAPGGFRELGEAFDAVMEKFRGERSDKEAQAAYLQAFVRQLPIAVFALAEDGRILVANQAFQDFVGRRPCHHLDHLREFDARLADFVAGLRPGRGQSLHLQRPYGQLHIKLSCTLLRQRGQQHKLVSIQDISGDLESRELEAWHNLIRVMTHEIMNSITPITSLADTLKLNVADARDKLAPPTAIGAVKETDPTALALLDDAMDAAATIGKRGHGLLRFVESYRTLSRLPMPRPRVFRVKGLLETVATLMREQAALQQATLVVSCNPETLELRADPELLEQALINLVRNALDAVAGMEAAVIRLHAELRDFGVVALLVEDRGCGIAAEHLENIFVPFFTTKRGGNGIGMTLVRRIVTQSGGSVQLHSHAGEGTSVALVFP